MAGLIRRDVRYRWEKRDRPLGIESIETASGIGDGLRIEGGG